MSEFVENCLVRVAKFESPFKLRELDDCPGSPFGDDKLGTWGCPTVREGVETECDKAGLLVFPVVPTRSRARVEGRLLGRRCGTGNPPGFCGECGEETGEAGIAVNRS